MSLTPNQKRGGILSAAAIALAAGTASYIGFIPYWETGGRLELVVKHLPGDRPDVYTVCDGVTNLDPAYSWIRPGMKFTKEQCAKAFATLLPEYAARIEVCVPEYKDYPPYRQVSILSFGWNAGTGAICGDRRHSGQIARELNAHHYGAACNLMGQYIKANGSVLRGLERRRYGFGHNHRFDPSWGEIAWCLRED